MISDSDIIRPSKTRINMVIFGTCIGAMLLYQAIATFGYFTFHELLIQSPAGGDLLNMYPTGDIAITIGTIGLIVTVILSYPLLVHPTRSSLLYIFFAFIRPPPNDDGVIVIGQRQPSNDVEEQNDALDDGYGMVDPVASAVDDVEEPYVRRTTMLKYRVGRSATCCVQVRLL